MNSGLQCLANTRELADIFLSSQYKQDLNAGNKLGTGGKLAKAFAALLREMSAGKTTSVSPWGFKRELGDFVPQFYGFQQQDSHELITYTLDLLHEDLNRVKKKPIPREIPTNGLSDEMIAEKFWEAHLSRNRSAIVDMMHGQYRSQVTCPHCHKISLTFDPFVSISLPLSPKSTQNYIEAYFLPYPPTQPTLKFRLQFTHGAKKVSDLRESAASELGISPDSVKFAKAYHYSVVDFLSDDAELPELTQYWALAVLEVPASAQHFTILLDVVKKPESRYYQKSSLGFSRVLLISDSASYRDVHLTVYRFLSEMKRLALTPRPEPPLDYDPGFQADFSTSEAQRPYSLYMVNLQREKNHSAGWIPLLERQRCDYCERRDCSNCELPVSRQGCFRDLVGRNKSGRAFRLEAVLVSNSAKDVTMLGATHIHPSITRGIEEERRLKEQSYTLQECLRHSSLPETLDSANEVYCSPCRKHVQAEKQMTLYRLSKVLIIHLKRFKDRGYRKEKDERLIRFPIEGLDMREFVRNPGRDSLVYDLYAVSNHYGGMGGGHYTAAASWGKGEWVEFNDAVAARITGRVEDKVVTPAAYVLFYRRREGAG